MAKEIKTLQERLNDQADVALRKEVEELFAGGLGSDIYGHQFVIQSRDDKDSPIKVEWWKIREQLVDQYIELRKEQRRSEHTEKFMREVTEAKERINEVIDDLPF